MSFNNIQEQIDLQEQIDNLAILYEALDFAILANTENKKLSYLEIFEILKIQELRELNGTLCKLIPSKAEGPEKT